MASPTEFHQVVFRRVSPADLRAFDQLFDIYVDVFPPNERKPRATLLDMIKNSSYYFLVLELNNDVISFAILRTFDREAVLLEYMGVARKLWDQGWGHRTFKHIVTYPDFSDLYIILEVESDKGLDPRDDRVRRKQFYRSLDCLELGGLDYVMPQVGESKPPPMNILIRSPSANTSIRKSDLIRWLSNIYSQIYHLSARHRNISVMVRSLPDNIFPT